MTRIEMGQARNGLTLYRQRHRIENMFGRIRGRTDVSTPTLHQTSRFLLHQQGRPQMSLVWRSIAPGLPYRYCRWRRS